MNQDNRTPPDGQLLWNQLPPEIKLGVIACEAGNAAQQKRQDVDLPKRADFDDVSSYAGAMVTHYMPMANMPDANRSQAEYLRTKTPLDPQSIEAIINFRSYDKVRQAFVGIAQTIESGLRSGEMTPVQARDVIEYVRASLEHLGAEASVLQQMQANKAGGESPLDKILRGGKGGRSGGDEPPTR